MPHRAVQDTKLWQYLWQYFQPPQFNDQMPSITDVQHWNARSLRRAAAEEDGMDPDAVDPSFESEFEEFRARWPQFYKQGRLDRT